MTQIKKDAEQAISSKEKLDLQRENQELRRKFKEKLRLLNEQIRKTWPLHPKRPEAMKD